MPRVVAQKNVVLLWLVASLAVKLVTVFTNAYQSFIRWQANYKARTEKKKATDKNPRAFKTASIWHENWINQFSPIKSSWISSQNVWKIQGQKERLRSKR